MESPRSAAYDPLRFCIFTTIALLSWVLSPPVVVAALGGVGLWAYARARRQGLAAEPLYPRRHAPRHGVPRRRLLVGHRRHGSGAGFVTKR